MIYNILFPKNVKVSRTKMLLYSNDVWLHLLLCKLFCAINFHLAAESQQKVQAADVSVKYIPTPLSTLCDVKSSFA